MRRSGEQSSSTTVNLSRIYTRFGPYVFNRTKKFSDPAVVGVCQASRQFPGIPDSAAVSAGPRQRAVPRQTMTSSNRSRQRRNASPVFECSTAPQTKGVTLNASWWVDAMGRSARTPAFLEDLGYGKPAEERSTGRATYSSLYFLRHPREGAIAEKQVIVQGLNRHAAGSRPTKTTTWILTVGRLGIDGRPAHGSGRE